MGGGGGGGGGGDKRHHEPEAQSPYIYGRGPGPLKAPGSSRGGGGGRVMPSRAIWAIF